MKSSCCIPISVPDNLGCRGMQFVLRRDKQCRLLRERERFYPAGVKLSESKWGGGIGGREKINALGKTFRVSPLPAACIIPRPHSCDWRLFSRVGWNINTMCRLSQLQQKHSTHPVPSPNYET